MGHFINLNEDFFTVVKTEFLLDGFKIPYDACTSKSLEDAKLFYCESENVWWEYLGSGDIMFINDKKLDWKGEVHHFFKRHNKVLTTIPELV